MLLQQVRDHTRHLPLWIFSLVAVGVAAVAAIVIKTAVQANSTHALSKVVTALTPTTTLVQSHYDPNGSTIALAWITALAGVVMAFCAVVTMFWGFYTARERRIART